jgi:hypothetical protein
VLTETKAIVEQVIQGRKQRPRRAEDLSSVLDGGLVRRGTCRHVIGPV